MDNLAWMAWTTVTACFFGALALTLVAMIALAIRKPEVERLGALGIPTTRGDRLFITLLGSAFIHLAWLGFFGPDQLWWASGVSLAYAIAVFRMV